MPKNTKDNPQASTQNSLLISEIKDGVIILKDGSLRAVIMASAINFDLMSQQEQNGVEYAFQGFLNSLHFPIQIAIKSQKIDLDSYIEDLEKKHAAQDNPLLALLMQDYIANVKALVEEVNIMDKQFYVVVPFFPSVASKAGFFGNVSNLFKTTPTITVSETEFQQYKTELTNRVQLVSSGLSQMGIRAIPLNTQELVELYYTSYNPDVAPSQKLINHSELQTASVTKGERPSPAPAAIVTPEASVPVAPQTEVQPTYPTASSEAYTEPVSVAAQPQPVMPQTSEPVGATPAEVQVSQPVQDLPPVPGQQFQPAQPTMAPPQTMPLETPSPMMTPEVPIAPTDSPSAPQPVNNPMPPNPLEEQQ